MNMSGRRAELIGAIDRYGGDFNRWPDGALANEVRSAVLADRALRGRLDDARALEQALLAVRDVEDAEVAASGAAARVQAAVMASPLRHQRRSLRHPWIAIAAGLVMAAGLGSFIDLAVVQSGDRSYEVVVVDPLVFGAATVEQ